MRQQDIIARQLAQKVTDFIEPVIPYLVIGSKKAAEEARKQVGPEVWEIKRKLWGKLCSTGCVGLKEAAKDMIVAPSDTEVRQVLTQEILKLLEENPDLTEEISSFMEDESIQRLMTEYNPARATDQNSKQESKQISKQTLIDRLRVFEEFNRLLEGFAARKGTSEGLERSEMPDTEKLTGSGVTGKKSASALRLEQIAEIKQIEKTDFERAYVAKNNLAKICFGDTGVLKAEPELQNESERTKNLLLQISYLEKPEKQEVLKKALDFASRIQYGDLRSQALSLVIPHLNGPEKAELIGKALESASHIHDEDERALVLSSLLPHLRDQGKEELIEKIFGFAYFFKYGDIKFQILSSLLPHLYGSRNEILIEKALELVTVIHSRYQRVQALSSLITYLNEQRKQEVIDQALELAFTLNDKDMRPEALSYILPYLEEPERKEILKKALDMASEIKSEYQKAEALSSLAPFLGELESEEVMGS